MIYQVASIVAGERWLSKGGMPIRRREPVLGRQPDYSRAFYPDPPSHDFLTWLVIAELMRRHHTTAAPLKVKFGLINGQLGVIDYGPFGLLSRRAFQCGVSREYSDQMMANVLRPAIAMIGAVEEPEIHAPFSLDEIEHHCEYDYHIGHLVDAARAGHQVPRFVAPQWAHDEVERYLERYLGKECSPVVITLREAAHQPERNSRLEDWLRFGGELEVRGYRVVILRDTCRATEGLPFLCYPRASENAYVRLALYQRALVNMMTSNGPVGWCQFSDAPFLCFKQLVPALPDWQHGGPAGWKEQAHMEVGEQYPWASPRQRLTWADDTFDNIRAAFDEFIG